MEPLDDLVRGRRGDARPAGLCALFRLQGRRGAARRRTARSLPAATSRTPPIRSAPAPRPAAIAAMVAAGGRRIAEIARDRRRRGSRHALRRLPPAHPRVRRRPTRRSMSPAADGLRRSFTLDELLPFAFGPDDLAALDERRCPGHRTPDIAEAAAFVRGRGFDGRFDCAMVLGTGLGSLADDLEDAGQRRLCRHAAFPAKRRLRPCGQARRRQLERQARAAAPGRAHYYETGDAAAMRIPLGVVAALGVPALVLTNAAGSMQADCAASAASSRSPTTSTSRAPTRCFRDRTEARFVALTGAYDERLRTEAEACRDRGRHQPARRRLHAGSRGRASRRRPRSAWRRRSAPTSSACRPCRR